MIVGLGPLSVAQLGAPAVAEGPRGLVAALALAAQHGQLVALALLGVLLELGEHEAQRPDTVLLLRPHGGRQVGFHLVGKRHSLYLMLFALKLAAGGAD